MRHPLHPALVHFPVACWSLAAAADLASLHWGELAWRFGGIALVAGVAVAIPAMLAGFYEFSRLADDSPATGDVYRHMGAMSAAFVLYAASLLLRVDHMALIAPAAPAIVCSVAGFLCLAVGGWLGGKLVYGHRLGGGERR